MKAIRVARTGGPEVLELAEVDRPRPGAGEALVRVAAAGVNYIDVYHRTGLYSQPLPFTPGSEGAGVVEEVGAGVNDLRPGERVAWAMAPGSYAELAVVPAARLVPVPPELPGHVAAAVMLQGMTAHYLALSTVRLGPGSTVLVHAAAGGVGALLVQIAKRLGARVFGTASAARLDVVRAAGADAAIDYGATDFAVEVMQLTEGAGVDAVYDSVGRTTIDGSLSVVGRRGTLALFGQSSGPVAPIDPMRLARNGIYLTRPSLAHYTATREELLRRAGDVFDWILAGTLTPRIDRQLPLAEAATAHRLLEGRATAGKLLLIP